MPSPEHSCRHCDPVYERRHHPCRSCATSPNRARRALGGGHRTDRRRASGTGSSFQTELPGLESIGRSARRLGTEASATFRNPTEASFTVQPVPSSFVFPRSRPSPFGLRSSAPGLAFRCGPTSHRRPHDGEGNGRRAALRRNFLAEGLSVSSSDAARRHERGRMASSAATYSPAARGDSHGSPLWGAEAAGGEVLVTGAPAPLRRNACPRSSKSE